MQRFATVALVLGLAGLGLAFAAETETREGYLMPTACKERGAAGEAETHTTECALKEGCVASGFGLLVNDDFLEFDDTGDGLAKDYFLATDKVDHHVVHVKGDFSGAEVKVESLAAAAD